MCLKLVIYKDHTKMHGQQNIKKCNIPLSVSHLVLNCKLAIVFVNVFIYINSIGQVLREGVSGR